MKSTCIAYAGIVLLLVVLTSAGGQDRFADYERLTFTGSSSDELLYSLLRPRETQDGATYPLVLALHGVGGRGKEKWEWYCGANHVLCKPQMRKRFPCFVVAPTCSPRETWWRAKSSRGKSRMQDLLELVDELVKDLPIDKQRIYVTGHSMGGFGTFGALRQRPDLFAAAAPIAGGSDPATAKNFANVPIWIFHGAKDKGIPVERSREMVKALREAGGEPKYTEFPDVRHNAGAPAYKNEKLWEWLFAQRRDESRMAR